MTFKPGLCVRGNVNLRRRAAVFTNHGVSQMLRGAMWAAVSEWTVCHLLMAAVEGRLHADSDPKS